MLEFTLFSIQYFSPFSVYDLIESCNFYLVFSEIPCNYNLSFNLIVMCI